MGNDTKTSLTKIIPTKFIPYPKQMISKFIPLINNSTGPGKPKNGAPVLTTTIIDGEKTFIKLSTCPCPFDEIPDKGYIMGIIYKTIVNDIIIFDLHFIVGGTITGSEQKIPDEYKGALTTIIRECREEVGFSFSKETKDDVKKFKKIKKVCQEFNRTSKMMMPYYNLILDVNNIEKGTSGRIYEPYVYSKTRINSNDNKNNIIRKVSLMLCSQKIEGFTKALSKITNRKNDNDNNIWGVACLSCKAVKKLCENYFNKDKLQNITFDDSFDRSLLLFKRVDDLELFGLGSESELVELETELPLESELPETRDKETIDNDLDNISILNNNAITSNDNSIILNDNVYEDVNENVNENVNEDIDTSYLMLEREIKNIMILPDNFTNYHLNYCSTTNEEKYNLEGPFYLGG